LLIIGSTPDGGTPNTKAVDAFTCDWRHEMCPPPYLAPRVIHHAARTGAKGTVECTKKLCGIDEIFHELS